MRLILSSTVAFEQAPCKLDCTRTRLVRPKPNREPVRRLAPLVRCELLAEMTVIVDCAEIYS